MGGAKDNELQGGGGPGRQCICAGQRCEVLHHGYRQLGLQLGQFLSPRRCQFRQRHHTLTHEGYQATGDANHQVTFHRPDGTTLGATRPRE
jgi:hypothetical protein